MILIRTFKDTQSRGVIGLFLLLAGIYLPTIIGGVSTSLVHVLHEHSMPLYNLLFGKLEHHPFWSPVFSLILILLISLLLIRISFRDQLLYERSMFPAFFFVLIAVMVPGAQFLNPMLIAAIFYLLSFSILFQTHDERPNTLKVFGASLLLALGSLFWLKLIWFVPLIWLTLLTIRAVTWREMVYPLVAYMLLALFFLTWYWGIKNDMDSFLSMISDNMSILSFWEKPHFSLAIFFGLLLFYLVLGSIYRIQKIQTSKTVVQNIYQVLFYLFIGGVLVFLFIARLHPGSLVFIAIPASFALSAFFHRKRKSWILEVMLWILLFSAVLVRLKAGF